MVAHAGSDEARRWLESGWLDAQFYGELRGRPFRDAAEAADDFVSRGMRELLSPHPSLHFVTLPPATRRAWRNGRVRRVLADLRSHDRPALRLLPPTLGPSPPATQRGHLLDLARRLARERAGHTDPAPPPVDWAAVAARPCRTDRICAVVVADDARPTIRTVAGLLEAADGEGPDVVVLDRGSPPHVALGIHGVLHGLPGVQVVRLSGAVSASAAAELGLLRSTGAVVLLVEPHVVLRRGAVAALVAALEDPDVAGVQPVVLGPDDRIVSAGLVVAADGDPPAHVLTGHQADDSRRLEGERLGAISRHVMALRVEDVAAVDGLGDPMPGIDAALDLCARLLRRRPGGFRVAPAARATALVPADGSQEAAAAAEPHAPLPPDPALYRRIGFLTDWTGGPAGRPGSRLVVTGRRRTTPDQLRWSIKLPSTPGRQGDVWGDTHFAGALAEALRGLGDDVVTSRHGAHAAGPTHLDDVSLALRGLYPIPPTPGQVNVLWVISHPDDVDPGELEGYDVVLAASRPWSVELSARTGREVVPLLQATEFAPPPAAPPHDPREPGVLFVGNAGDGRERPLVRMAVDAGVALTVYGRGWDDLPAGAWRGEYVDNRRLPELYHRHGTVLADHWPDMARNGFIANRVFDAVASGARVICDDVAGVHEVFDPRDVLVVRTPEDMGRAVAELRRTTREADVPRPALSFDDRARTLRALLSDG